MSMNIDRRVKAVRLLPRCVDSSVCSRRRGVLGAWGALTLSGAMVRVGAAIRAGVDARA